MANRNYHSVGIFCSVFRKKYICPNENENIFKNLSINNIYMTSYERRKRTKKNQYVMAHGAKKKRAKVKK